jgi:hypothetical protein
MGLPDLYPFVIPLAVVEKLRFIHQVISRGPVNVMPAGGISLDTTGSKA